MAFSSGESINFAEILAPNGIPGGSGERAQLQIRVLALRGNLATAREYDGKFKILLQTRFGSAEAEATQPPHTHPETDIRGRCPDLADHVGTLEPLGHREGKQLYEGETRRLGKSMPFS